ncbi:MAG: thioredoxin domain-containing protein [Nanoarchaeota archaeon]|nr:thioredoxin domain-containing protein [Nanoarchaeota archaeon]
MGEVEMGFIDDLVENVKDGAVIGYSMGTLFKDIQVEASRKNVPHHDYDQALGVVKKLQSEAEKRVHGDTPYEMIKSNPGFVLAVMSGGLAAVVRNMFLLSAQEKKLVDEYVTARRADYALEYRKELAELDPESVVLQLTGETFDTVISQQKYAVVDMYGVPCAPCKALAPLFLEAAQKYSQQALFANINVYEASEISSRFKIRGVPTTLILKDGKEVARSVGGMNRDLLLSFIEDNII